MTQTAAAVFRTPGIGEEFICQELTEMGTHQLIKTSTEVCLTP
jgi:16S rRNA U1498 N3-methylase RsmE